MEEHKLSNMIIYRQEHAQLVQALRDEDPTLSAALLAQILTHTQKVEVISLFCADEGWPSELSPISTRLDALKTLVLTGWNSQSYFQCGIIDMASNLRTLILGFGTAWEKGCFHVPNLPNLERLIVEGPNTTQMTGLVSSCPKLRDIEYYLLSDEDASDVGLVINAVMPVREQLRRLHIAHVPAIYAPSDEDQAASPFALVSDLTHDKFEEWGLTIPRMHNFKAAWKLANFTSLEELGIDYGMVYGWPGHRGTYFDDDDEEEDRPNTGWLQYVMPRSLRSLRLWYTPCSVEDDLNALINEAPDRYPALQNVTIGAMTESDPDYCHWDAADLEATKHVIRRQIKRTNSPIKFTWELDSRAINLRARWPGDTVFEDALPFVDLGDIAV
jgi:hypothetical protein